ncbi:MAG: hypothetical protein ACERKD_04770 [Prolixibacteraceae bacterium]
MTIVLLLSAILSTASSDQQLANQFFKDGNFRDALPLYAELNRLYPNDGHIQYCYGLCLTETGHAGQQAKKLLLHASQGDVPNNVYFYIAKNYHLQQDFSTALSYYRRFEELASRKEIKALNLNEILASCAEQQVPFEQEGESIGPVRPNNTYAIIDTNAFETDTRINSNNPVVKKIVPNTVISRIDSTISSEEAPTLNQLQIPSTRDTIQTNLEKTEAILPRQVRNDTISTAMAKIPGNLMDSTIDFTISSEIWYLKVNQFKTTEGQTAFIGAWKNEHTLDSILREIKQLREEYSTQNNDDQKAQIAVRVMNMEQKTMELKVASDEGYLKSIQLELAYWKHASDDEIQILRHENDSIAGVLLAPQSNETLVPTASGNEQSIELHHDSVAIEPIPKMDDIDEVNKIIYRIQIGSYSNGLPDYIDRQYQKLGQFRKIDHYTDDKGITVYTIGEVKNLDDAIKLQAQIRQEGVKDAFVVAYNNGKRITLKEARELTKK